MIELITWGSVVIGWVVGIILNVTKKNPAVVAFIGICHLIETLTFGVKTGMQYGKSFPYSLAMSLSIGSVWWLPLIRKMKKETFTDDDFIRRPDDCVVNREG